MCQHQLGEQAQRLVGTPADRARVALDIFGQPPEALPEQALPGPGVQPECYAHHEPEVVGEGIGPGRQPGRQYGPPRGARSVAQGRESGQQRAHPSVQIGGEQAAAAAERFQLGDDVS
jgi:hypothetical protein